MSLRDEWLAAANSDGKFFLTSEEVAARLASADCTDSEREWFASVKPIGLTSALDDGRVLRIFGNPLSEGNE